jgi:uncharacterized protein
MKPTYFDFTVETVGKAKKFFEQVFGWRFERFAMPYEYYRIQAGAQYEPGIDGGIGEIGNTAISGGKPLTQVTVPAANLDEYLARVSTNGGRIVEARMPVPGIGSHATCAEPGGLMFGIIEADPNAR